jgi:threonine dehydrogenase-like Zn-dependent dehydrogenase
MLALVTTPGRANTTHVSEVPDIAAGPGQVLLSPLRIGVCGTDREISDGLFGVAPDGEDRLILGHELLARVAADGNGFTRGDLVCATVRRTCGHCIACAQGSPDSCLTGDYRERGITRVDGFAAEMVAESSDYLIPVPSGLGGLGVLGEPASICARGIRHAEAVANRQPWMRRRALVLGTGAIGMLSTYLLRLEGYEVWTAGRSGVADERARLVVACGAIYFCTADTSPAQAASDVGGFDLVVEATGDAQVMIDTLGLLSRNGVACLLGIDGRPREVKVDGRVLGVDTILQNRALVGSVNAHRQDWETGLDALYRARSRWPDAVESFVGLTVGVDSFAEAFAYRGVKATLRLGDT